jgi:hypothetical protein
MLSFRCILLLIIPGFLGAQSFNDIKLLENNSNELIYEISIQNFEFLERENKEGQPRKLPYFEYAYYPDNAHLYSLPSRSLKFAVPENGDLQIQIISSSEKTYPGVNILEYPLSENEIKSPHNKSLLIIGDKYRFRDFLVRDLQINPVVYNESQNSITLTEKLVLKINFTGAETIKSNYRKMGALDKLYPDILVNFEQAKSWQLKKSLRLSKPSALGLNTYYGIKVEEDGIYKVTASALNNNGIDTESLSINALQLYNNGGHELSYATTATIYNPPFTQEVAIQVFDLNNNFLFDGSDYFLFYGKSLNSWFYNQAEGKFKFHKHRYDNFNIYYIAINGSSGKRIQLNELADIPGAVAQDYFTGRIHNETDSYNILDSGPDWYGHRFFGRSGSFSINFNLNNISAANINSQIELRMKGGSGSHYGDDLSHRYQFEIFLNNNALNFRFAENANVFNNSSRVTKSIDLNSSVIKTGENTLSFNYSGNQNESFAFIDYFSIFYPKQLTVSNNFLNFYTVPGANPIRYNLNGFSNINDINILDVSNPLTPVMLLSNRSASGTFQFDFPASDQESNLIIFSLTSPAIKNVSNFTKFTPHNDLLNTSKSADFIIITKNSLLDYGNQIAGLRDHLKTEVVSVEDINFFFNNGVQDPVAIRNFIRYAYNNWQTPSLSYVLLFGDGHYDYRNISIRDSIIVPTFQIYAEKEITWGGAESRESDIFFGQTESDNDSELQLNIRPSIAIGRIPIENSLDAERIIEKLIHYKQNPVKDGWQMYLTFVGDDEKTSNPSAVEWQHQVDAERIAKQVGINKYLKKKIYLSAFEEVPGGLGRLKPKANQELIDQINRGALIVNYTGHGSPTQWAHESVLNFDRDYSRINNEYKYPLVIAATCDFGLFDNPSKVSFSEALIWKEKSGAIGVLAASRLVYSSQNYAFSSSYYRSLFPNFQPSITLGDAFVVALNNGSGNNVNDQKYHLLADPSMYLAEGREQIQIISVSQDTLKALSTVEVTGSVQNNSGINSSFNGGAIIIVNDAGYSNIQTGGTSAPAYDMDGPLIFKGEVTVENGMLSGSFIVPKTIRYDLLNRGKISIYAWDDQTNTTASTYRDDLIFAGSSNIDQENDGPQIDIYFEGQENFSSGDLISANPVLIADISDESGINITGQLGHKISLSVNNNQTIDISESFVYNRDSYTSGTINYPLTGLSAGEHSVALQVFDNLNNRSQTEISFSITESEGLEIRDIINYPNPFRQNTEFTFQTNISGADVNIKIYTIAGRLIQTLTGYSTVAGYNTIEWDGSDRDGNSLANGVYLYKIIIRYDGKVKEKIEKMVVLH